MFEAPGVGFEAPIIKTGSLTFNLLKGEVMGFVYMLGCQWVYDKN